MAGTFFSFDGIDGAGKSTQIRLFVDWLGEQGVDAVCCRDPGGTPLGEAVRAIVLGRSDLRIDARAELLLYMASRAQLVDEVIRPALAAGRTVVSDRFLLANVVYQGYAGGVAVEQAWQVGRVATGGIVPTLTFLLDLDESAAANRIQRERDRMESRGREFLRAVRAGFLAEASQQRMPIRVVNADRDVPAIQDEIRAAAQPFLDAQ